jgi:hypothetical protein|tara:strand:- start:381 stop:695 length:315 start_codon:yes stop_codon:yes gene_type:complete
MINEEYMKNLNDLEFFDTTTKKEPFRNTVTPIMKAVVNRPEFVETSKVLTYELTGEKYKVMKVVPGYLEWVQVGEVKEKGQTWKDDDVLDKIFTKLAKKSKKKS